MRHVSSRTAYVLISIIPHASFIAIFYRWVVVLYVRNHYCSKHIPTRFKFKFNILARYSITAQMNAPKHEYVKYLVDQYVEKSAIRSLPEELQPLADAVIPFPRLLARMTHNVYKMRNIYAQSKYDFTTIVYEIEYDETQAIYAFLYVLVVDDANADGSAGGVKIVPQRICLGGTFGSQDGEYRYGVITWHQYLQIFETYEQEMLQAEALVAGMLDSGDMGFHTHFYFPDSRTAAHGAQIRAFVNESRTMIRFAALCWIRDFYRIKHKVAENHIHPGYQYIMYDEDDNVYFNKIIELLGAASYKSLIYKCFTVSHNINITYHGPVNNLMVGQKIMPLTYYEVEQVENVNYDTWRELYINQLTSNLVLNQFTPCFPFIGHWHFIADASEHLFDNIAIHKKYAQAAQAKELARQLAVLNKYNYVDGNLDDEPVSDRAGQNSAMIQRLIKFIRSTQQYSKYALCVTYEHTGFPMRDLPLYIAREQYVFAQGLAPILSNFTIFKKHVFEIIYSLYCLNSRYQILHGDLHMNNVGIYQFEILPAHKEAPDFRRGAQTLYLAGADKYLLPYTGIYSVIFDFSRAVMGDKLRIVRDFGPRVANSFIFTQVSYIKRLLMFYVSDFYDNHAPAIDAMLDEDTGFAYLFKIMTAVDTHVFAQNMITLLTTADATIRAGEVQLDAKIVPYLQTIADAAKHIFVEGVRAWINKINTSPADIEWPNLTLLRAHLKDFIVHDMADVNSLVAAQPAVINRTLSAEENARPLKLFIADVYNGTDSNDIVYEIEDPETAGPIMSLRWMVEYYEAAGKPIPKEMLLGHEMAARDDTEARARMMAEFEQSENLDTPIRADADSGADYETF